ARVRLDEFTSALTHDAVGLKDRGPALPAGCAGPFHGARYGFASYVRCQSEPLAGRPSGRHRGGSVFCHGALTQVWGLRTLAKGWPVFVVATWLTLRQSLTWKWPAGG
ncbi:MAG: hypothetical protein ITD39_03770, partial [Nitrospira sp.]|nr:hypothetical protein [Nitrospira sp.]